MRHDNEGPATHTGGAGDTGVRDPWVQGPTPADPTVAGANGQRRPKRPGWNWVAGGTIAGFALGVLCGVLGSAGTGDAGSGAASADDVAVAHIEPALADCGVDGDTTGITVMDDGASLALSTAGEERSGANFHVICVLNGLGMPESVGTRMTNTRALDGRQDAAWDTYQITWGYHPDNGLDIVVETAR